MTKPISLGFLVGSTYKPLIKTLSLNFLAGTTLDSRITFSRGTNATLVDSTGKLTYAPNNLVLRSEEFDNASWTKVNSSVSPNVTTAPNGTFTADKIVENTAVTTGHYINPANISTAIGQRYILSVYAKAAERTFLQLITTGPAPGGGNLIAGFDLANGTAGTPSSTATSTITPVGDGWYRCSLAFPVSAGTTAGIQIRISLTSGTSPSDYTGNGSSGLFLWGAQIELVTYQTAPSTYVQTVASAYHGPRFDYDPVTLVPRGLLIEEQRVNLTLYSEQFDNAAWTKTTGSVTSNTTTSPDGTTNADAFIETAAGGYHFISQPVTKAASNILYTGSFYVKDKGRQVAFNIQNVSGSNGVQGRVNPATGTVTQNATAFGSGFTAGTITITNAGNGWYRVVMTATSDTSTIVTFQLMLHNGTTTLYTGDGVSGAFLYGAQLEAATFPTSYIPTVATATRANESAVMTGTNFSSWYNTLEGTFVVSASTASTAASKGVYAASDGTNSNRIYLSVTTEPNHLIVTSGVSPSEADITISSAISNNTVFRDAFAYRQNDVNAATNGVLGTADLTAILPVVNQFRIGARGDGSNIISGHVRSLDYYPVRWANAQLPSLTI